MNGPAAFCNPSLSPIQRNQTQFSIIYLYLILYEKNPIKIFKKKLILHLVVYEHGAQELKFSF